MLSHPCVASLLCNLRQAPPLTPALFPKGRGGVRHYFFAAACAASQSAWVFCMVKPWPLHEFWPLQELVACLQAPWPLQDEEFMHLTAAWSPEAWPPTGAADTAAAANRPATITAMALALTVLMFISMAPRSL